MDERDDIAFERIGIGDLSQHLADILQEVRRGASFVVTSEGEDVAEIRPAAPPVRRDRAPGALKGRIRMAADFDSLPADLLAAMEGEAT